MTIGPEITAYYGTVIHSTSPAGLRILDNTLLIISHVTGNIDHLIPGLQPDRLSSTLASLHHSNITINRLSAAQFIIPGFIDTHNHAPQWLTRGLGQGMHILDWLREVTFPAEARYADEEHARLSHKLLVKGMLRQGVTTASYYSSLHGPATRILADTCLSMGQRALVGKCNMNRGSPGNYIDASTEQSMKVTHECIDHIRTIDPEASFVRPVLTPRFAISCTPDLLTQLGALAAKEPTIPIQTHFNEAQQEIDATLSLFPSHKDEVSLYSSFGLLNDRSILAHCTIMKSEETQRLAELGCGIAHCPTANMTVGGGFMAAPVRDFLNRGMKVGLGTDSGGGYSSSMLNAMRHALIASFAREANHGDSSMKGLSIDEAFWMATLGGAKVVGLGDSIGNFAVGKQFDAVLVDMDSGLGGVNAPFQGFDSPRTLFEKFILTGDDRNMLKVFVNGRLVHSQS
ncbi:guanine deaminase [Aaosphaeria arxii CBS 175.79]|uniref:Probable guanine deaminase n=1 Tax=Aaosphaeria arxii CBS 175.79 TaxID=1450172 RepID=A0A6A5X8X9_9PLEO|nr:guanine deaminase [Aaosphaeria arxii CBS 175.79]KAF2009412.1 guanine deaminase [Aaosphaeria arxii CBS 175.79]